jgi:hypothetical protein
MLSPMAAGQEDTADEAENQEYLSIRIDVWSKDYKSLAQDGSGLKLKIALSTALFRYRTLDDLLNRDTEHINAVGIRPKLDFEYPTSIPNVSFVPELELALNRSLDTSNRALSGAATAALLHRRNGDDKDIGTRIGVKYGTRYEQDGLNFDDYVEVSLSVYLKQMRGFRVAQRNLTLRPYGEIKRFADDLKFETESGALFDIDRQYEIGLEFNTDPRIKIWGIAMPRVKLGYVFGDDFKGIKIRI